jgi:hypothetical protein
MSSRSRAAEKWAMPLFIYLISKTKMQAVLRLCVYFSIKLKSATPAPLARLIKINRSGRISTLQLQEVAALSGSTSLIWRS